MVVFTCNHCGESLQKPRVEKHFQTTTCSRKPVAVSCMDCFKDFKLEEYVSHTKCITEDERYSAKGTVHGVKKGEAKQSSWVQTVNTIIDQQQNARPSVKRLLEMICKYDNIPRKKVKFINFVNSSSGGKIAPNDMEEVWGLLEAHKNAAKAETEQTKKRKSDDDAATEATSEESAPKKKKKEGKVDAPANTATQDEGSKSSKKKKRSATDAATEEKVESKEPEAVTNGEQPKKKKKKNKTTEKTTTEDATVNGNGEAVETAAEENSKKKKTKPEQNGAEESAVNGSTTENETTEDKIKKKKKNKDKTESADAAKVEVVPETNGTEESGKKKKKSKAKGVENGTVENGGSQTENTEQNGSTDADKQSKKKKNKKEPANENGINESPNKNNDDDGFCWRTVIIEETKKKSKGISKDKLKAIVFERYEAFKGKIDQEGKMTKQYHKKLKKIGNIKVENDLVMFVE